MIARNLLAALVWAALIAISTWPIYTPFALRVAGRRTSVLASLLFTSLIGLVLLMPVALAATGLFGFGAVSLLTGDNFVHPAPTVLLALWREWLAPPD